MTTLSALVTGSAKRIGREIAIHLAKQGYHVALHYHQSETEAKQLAHELSLRYPSQLFPIVRHDLADWENSSALLDQLPAEMLPLHLLINNASVFEAGNLMASTSQLLSRNFAVNFFSPFELIRSFAIRFDEGQIINLLDVQVTRNESSHAAYLLAKKALMHLTQMAALEWAPRIRVNAIAPGPVYPATDGLSTRFEQVVAQTPMKTSVDISTILASVDYLMNAKQVTGQVIFADSGAHLT